MTLRRIVDTPKWLVEQGGVSYGAAVVLMRFPKVPHARPARGWRRHLRRVKAAQRRARK